MIGSMYDELSGIGDLADLGKQNPQEIADAISSAFRNITGAVKGQDSTHEPIPIQNVILILGGGYLLYKILNSSVRSDE